MTDSSTDTKKQNEEFKRKIKRDWDNYISTFDEKLDNIWNFVMYNDFMSEEMKKISREIRFLKEDVESKDSKIGRLKEDVDDLIYRNKAHLLQSSEDIVKMLNWDISKTTTPEQTRLFVELTDVEQKIVDFLQQKEQELLDVIALETHIPVYQLATILLQLELKNVVKPLPGKMFKLS